MSKGPARSSVEATPPLRHCGTGQRLKYFRRMRMNVTNYINGGYLGEDHGLDFSIS